ncbi:MAG: NAD-dependent epimerase/dehydratase family protein, partial [Halioglobus sp.]
RIMVRSSSDTRAIDHLDVERVIGDVTDREAMASAMTGCDSVFYCVVDTRAWLRDPAPLYATNVEGLRRAMDVALETGLARFVFTSTYGTLGINPSGVSTEKDRFNWADKAPDYVLCRVQAEDLFLEYCDLKGLPGVACLVGNTYGEGDVVPTPHGQLVKDAALGKMPIYWDGGGPCVGISDAARALLLAEEKGRVGARYIVAERWVSWKELFSLAAAAGGAKPPAIRLPPLIMILISGFTDVLSFFTRRDNRMSLDSLRCATLLPNVDSAKAREELGWKPEPIEKSIKEAVDFYLSPI